MTMARGTPRKGARVARAAAAAAVPHTATIPARRRLAPAERQHQILAGAIAYFASFGFDGRTRELASYLGISQALIFRYFPSKAALIDRVYDVVFLNRWNDAWEQTLLSRERPLGERLELFYRDYARSIDRHEVIRISLYSALRGETISERYMDRVRTRLILPMIGEIRAALALPNPANLPPHGLEEALVYSLHSQVIYAIMRRHVFHLPVPDDSDFLIGLYVAGFMAGLQASFKRIHERIAATPARAGV